MTMPAPAAPSPTSEDTIQAAVIRWARSHDDPRLHSLFHIPNGGQRDGAVGGRMVALGAKAGVSDLFLPVMNAGRGGLWIEMKTTDGHLSAEQEAWLNEMSASGYAAHVCYGWEQAVERIDAYMGFKA